MIAPVLVTCEKCGDEFEPDEQFYKRETARAAKRAAEQRKNKRQNSSAGSGLPRFWCDPCRCPAPTAAKSKSEHPLTNRRRASFEPLKLDRLPAVPYLITLTPREREMYGVIVTVREQTTGQLLTMAAQGPMTKSLAELCDRIDWLNGDFKIVTISTPPSIYRDLQGNRDIVDGHPERDSLAKAKRLDLLDPTLKRGAEHETLRRTA